MEDYEKLYKNAVKRIQTTYQDDFGCVHVKPEEIFPELKESDDEKIRKTLKSFFDSEISDYGNVEWRNGIRYGEIVSWLEKQGEIIDEYEDKLDRCACENFDKGYKAALETQGEQKPTNKIEPKFKVGDWITIDNPCQIISIDGNYIVQYCDDEKTHEISKKFCEFQFHLWTIQDAKDGDVLVWKIDNEPKDFICILKDADLNGYWSHCYLDAYINKFHKGTYHNTLRAGHPATKEQRDLLFQKMKEAGYEWDSEKKELNEIKQETELPNGEDYGIDSLYHAARILEKTLGDVDGYQSDDGILEHKCAIEAVNRLYKQKPAWSEEDERYYDSALWHIKNSSGREGSVYN